MAEVTGYRIAALQATIADALNQTSEASTLPAAEQAALLGKSCEQACGLLGDWQASSLSQLRPANDVPVKDLMADRARFEDLLATTLRDAMDQARRFDIAVDVQEIDRARKAIAETVRKQPRAKSAELFKTADHSVEALRLQVCDLARQLHSKAQDPVLRRKARRVLKVIAGLLPAIVISMAGAGPGQVSHDFSEWGREAAKVIAVHHIARSAQPSLRVTVSHLGPGPG